MKTLLVVDTPDSREACLQSMYGPDMCSLIQDWTDQIRNHVKHGDGKPVSWIDVQDEWGTLVAESGVPDLLFY